MAIKAITTDSFRDDVLKTVCRNEKAGSDQILGAVVRVLPRTRPGVGVD